MLDLLQILPGAKTAFSSSLQQQKPGGHFLSGVPPGQGRICFSKLIQDKAQESESDCSISFPYPDELEKV